MALLKPHVDYKYNILFGSWLPIYPLELFPLILACLEFFHVCIFLLMLILMLLLQVMQFLIQLHLLWIC